MTIKQISGWSIMHEVLNRKTAWTLTTLLKKMFVHDVKLTNHYVRITLVCLLQM